MKKLLIPLILLLFISCQEQQLEDPARDITVEEVRNFFQSDIQPNSGRSDAADIIWESANYRDISLGDALVFPLEDDRQVVFDDASSFDHMPAKATTYAFAYKQDGEIHMELVKLIPYEKSDGFTGAAIVENWNGEKLRYFEYENGVFLDEYEIVENQDEQGRTSEFIYTCTTTIYYTCWGDIPEDCRETDRETTCVVKEVRMIAGPGTNGEDYGGGGGDGGTVELCEHPFLNDTPYPCDICPNGYELYNGGCHPICEHGMVRDDYGNCVLADSPCPDDPLIQMEISTYNSGKNANRYGCVRVGSNSCGGVANRNLHGGIDLMADEGTPVYSLTAGTVYFAGSGHAQLGNWIVIESGSYYYAYAHLKDAPTHSAGDQVAINDIIGEVGDTGNPNAGEFHLHLSIRNQSTPGQGYNDATIEDPEDHLGTQFDENGDTIDNNNC